MKPALRKLLVAAIFFVASAAVNAASVTLLNVANSENRGGFYAGFYTLSVDNQILPGMCDDFSTNSTIGETWNANILTYSDIVAGGGKFGPNLVKYSQIGWLYSLAGAATSSQQASINEAVWKVMTPGAPALSGDALAYFNSATDTARDTFDFSGVMRILEPLPHSASQEFLIPIGSQVVPVPAAVWLLGSGLLTLAGLRRNSRR